MFKKCFLKPAALALLAVALLPSCANDGVSHGEEPIVIPFSFGENWDMIVMNAVVRGAPGQYLFDTGSSVSFVDGNKNPFLIRGLGRAGGSRFFAPIYVMQSVSVEGVEIRARSYSVDMTGVLSDYLVESLRGDNLDGILGNGIFAGYWVEMSFSRNEIILHGEIPERFADAPRAPLTWGGWRNNLMLYNADIDGHAVPLVIDSGRPWAFSFQNGLARLKTPQDLRHVASIDRAGDHYLLRANSINIMDIAVTDKVVVTNSELHPSDSRFNRKIRENGIGILGLHFMRHYDFLFDYRDKNRRKTTEMRYLPLAPHEDRDYGFYAFFEEAPKLGIMDFIFDYDSSFPQLLVTSVLTDSVAYDELGLRPGSIIRLINSTMVHRFSYKELYKLFFSGEAAVFSVIRDGERFDVYFDPN